jgi:hypothetical protein
MLEPHFHPPPFNHLSAPTRSSISKGADFTGCGKTASHVGFGVAQPFSAAVTTLLYFAAFRR